MVLPFNLRCFITFRFNLFRLVHNFFCFAAICKDGCKNGHCTKPRECKYVKYDIRKCVQLVIAFFAEIAITAVKFLKSAGRLYENLVKVNYD